MLLYVGNTQSQLHIQKVLTKCNCLAEDRGGGHNAKKQNDIRKVNSLLGHFLVFV